MFGHRVSNTAVLEPSGEEGRRESSLGFECLFVCRTQSDNLLEENSLVKCCVQPGNGKSLGELARCFLAEQLPLRAVVVVMQKDQGQARDRRKLRGIVHLADIVTDLATPVSHIVSETCAPLLRSRHKNRPQTQPHNKEPNTAARSQTMNANATASKNAPSRARPP